MEFGTFMDFCDEWNAANDPDYEKKHKEVHREATQYDWDVLLG